MTTKNAILLIIKQNKGIEYNALLRKVALNYSNMNSARAALSRAIKDLVAVGLVVRKGSNLYVTNKALAQISSEMKNKLLLKLNQTVKSKNSYLEIDTIVQYLQTLIERSKEDSSLLKAARGSTDFYISDLENTRDKLQNRLKHLKYLTNVFEEQIDSLKKMDFNDVREMHFSEDSVSEIKKIAKKLKLDEILLESGNSELLGLLSSELKLKPKGRNLIMPASSLTGVLSLIEREQNSGKAVAVNLYLSTIAARIRPDSISISGPYTKLKEFLG